MNQPQFPNAGAAGTFSHFPLAGVSRAGGLAAVAVTFTQQRDYIWGELPFTGACPHESLSVLKSSELKVPMQSEEIEERQEERKKRKKGQRATDAPS